MRDSLWLIEPFAPLIVADGRPFNLDPGARATSLDFPSPSVTAGGLRTRLGWDRGGDFKALQAELLATEVRGPLLVRLAADDSVITWYAPMPADAVVREDAGHTTRYRLQPLDPSVFPPDQTDLTAPAASQTLQLVAADRDMQGKSPAGALARWWSWPIFAQWLLTPHTGAFAIQQLQKTSDLVIIQRETRTHVQIQSATQRAADGMLFQTEGLSFSGTAADPAARFALVVWGPASFEPTVAPLGGERRLVAWRRTSAALPECDPELIKAIVASRACRIVLLTPAYWRHGFLPATVPAGGLSGVQVVAVVNQQPEVVSGWDVDLDRPKPSRRLAPAGTVLFVRLDGDAAAIAAWVEAMWLQPLNDDEQASRDGFGIAVLGTWDGRDLKEIRDAHTP